MHLKESTRKYILLGIVIFIIIGLVSAKVLAKKQDADFSTEDFLYQQALQLYSEGNYSEASIYISELVKEKPDSEVVNYLGGLIAASTEEYTKAAILLQKSLDINPHKVEDAMFMIQFGEALFLAERYEDASLVLKRCQKFEWAPEDYPNYQDRVTELLTLIESLK